MSSRPHRRWRWLGGAMVVAAYAPLHRLLDPARGGPAALATRAQADAAWTEAWTGSAMVIMLAALIVALVHLRMRLAGHGSSPSPAHRWGDATTRGFASVPRAVWAWGCALAAGGFTGIVATMFLHHRPTLADEFIQLRHARLLAGGRLADAWPFDAAFRNSVNGVWTPDGWASVYPPGHTAVLAAMSKLGLLEWTGPLLVAATVGFTAALVLRLLDERPATARMAAAAVAVSPFLAGIGSGYLSHTSAACATALALWAAVHARDGDWRWALLTGAAAGWALTARPLVGLAGATLIPVALWTRRAMQQRRATLGPRLHPDGGEPVVETGSRYLGVRLSAAAAAGLPFVFMLAAWNLRLFGRPWRFGYTAAFGPAHGLGFHRDPWGNLYSPLEAVGYTGADLALLGVRLFETPIPIVAVIGAWLLLRGRPLAGSGLFLAWAGVAMLANAFYWHHGLHMGPRMLYEAAPAWAVVTVLAVVGTSLPRGTLAPPTAEEIDSTPPPAPESLVALARVAAVVCLGWATALGIPSRVASWSLPPADELPAADSGSLVFVHGSWAGREAARLAAAGMRRDSVETALRRNDLCRVHEYAVARRNGTELPEIALASLPGSPPDLSIVQLSEGNRARVDPLRPLSRACAREARADREGTIELATVLARVADPSAEAPVIWVRDLGPDQNSSLLHALPDRRPLVWLPGTGQLIPYGAAMRRIWDP